jgi:hypothetical protein
VLRSHLAQLLADRLVAVALVLRAADDVALVGVVVARQHGLHAGLVLGRRVGRGRHGGDVQRLAAVDRGVLDRVQRVVIVVHGQLERDEEQQEARQHDLGGAPREDHLARHSVRLVAVVGRGMLPVRCG